MRRLTPIATHGLTAAVTAFVVASSLSGPRAAPKEPVLLQVPNPRAPGPRPAPPPARPPAVAPAPAPVPIPVDADEQVNIRVYAEVNRGVVHITTAVGELGLFGDETAAGSGSGFVLDRLGHVLTNDHVVDGAERLQVTLYDGSTHDAEVIGRDPPTDVAVLRIAAPANRLVPVRLGDSSRLLVGQKVLALGNPFGLERTLTTGIVSALDRSMKTRQGRTIKGIIQTDAAINPGNSGGPLLNRQGEVIGMNTAILSQVGQSAGIGFSVPINSIARILKPLIDEGHVTRADLGVRRVYSTERGLFIVTMDEDGPAERAGLRPLGVRVEQIGPFARRRLDPESADLIVAVDGRPVRSADELLTAIEAHAPGEVAVLTVRRDGRMREVRVKLGRS